MRSGRLRSRSISNTSPGAMKNRNTMSDTTVAGIAGPQSLSAPAPPAEGSEGAAAGSGDEVKGGGSSGSSATGGGVLLTRSQPLSTRSGGVDTSVFGGGATA